MKTPLVEAWQKNNDANLFLLKHLSEKSLANRYSEKTRTVAAQFAHIHNVRVYHLEKRGPEFLGKLKSFERGAQPKRSKLISVLKSSSTAISKFIQAGEEANKVKSWSGSPAGWLGYLIAHEAHHRALVTISMRLSGDPLPKDVRYNIWNWNKKGGLLGEL